MRPQKVRPATALINAKGKRMGISLLELWGTMGWFAKGIVFILLGMSIYVATIVIRKLIQLSRARKATLRFASPFSQALANEDFAEAERLVEAHPNSHLATAFHAERRRLGNVGGLATYQR